jgi:hypothetical protein
MPSTFDNLISGNYQMPSMHTLRSMMDFDSKVALHLRDVYATLCLTILSAAIGSYCHLQSHIGGAFTGIAAVLLAVIFHTSKTLPSLLRRNISKQDTEHHPASIRSAQLCFAAFHYTTLCYALSRIALTRKTICDKLLPSPNMTTPVSPYLRANPILSVILTF